MDHVARERLERTYEFYRRVLKSFHRFLPPGIVVEQLRPSHITDWIARHPAWLPSTRHGAIHAVKRAYRWAERESRIDRSPVASAEAPTPTRREVVITPDMGHADYRGPRKLDHQLSGPFHKY